jgi:hypothetical protein
MVAAEYSSPIGANETKGLRPKYTKIKTVSCGAQLARLKTFWRWAIVQPRGRGASIPSLKIEKRKKRQNHPPKITEIHEISRKSTEKGQNTLHRISSLKASATFQVVFSSPSLSSVTSLVTSGSPEVPVITFSAKVFDDRLGLQRCPSSYL